MKKLGFMAMTMLAGCLLATPLASARGQKMGEAKAGSAEEQIKALQAKTVEALLKGDTNFFEKYYADDALIIHSPGTVFTKAQEIEYLKSGALKYDSYDVRDQKARIYGNTAVVNILVSTKGVIASKPFSGDFRVTWVWVKLDGTWKFVSYQITKVA
jgi:uncharacterized protein (TIGR02246 family)